MSHIARIELEVNDLSTLDRACQKMGLKLVRNQKSYKWYYGDNTCDHAIVVPGANYEIGIHHKEGKYNLETDFWDEGIKSAIGDNGGLLKQRYAVERTKAEAVRQGYRVIEKQTDNKIRLHVRM